MIFFAVLVALQTRTRTDQTAGVKMDPEVWALLYEWAQHPVYPAVSRPTSRLLRISITGHVHQHRQRATHQ